MKIDIQNLSSDLGSNFSLKDISFEVGAGKIVTLLGRSGSGKTSLLRCLAGLRPFSAAARNIPKPFGMVFQSSNLFNHLTLSQNIKIALVKTQGKSKKEAENICDQVLTQVQLTHRGDALPHQLSGGEQQRGAIARTLALSPKVIFYDEPTSALDPELSLEIYDLMNALKSEGIIQVVVSHDTQIVKKIADYVGYMKHGELRWFGKAQDFRLEFPKLEQEEQKYLQLYQ